jgi:PAS domain S-box-containing protein
MDVTGHTPFLERHTSPRKTGRDWFGHFQFSTDILSSAGTTNLIGEIVPVAGRMGAIATVLFPFEYPFPMNETDLDMTKKNFPDGSPARAQAFLSSPSAGTGSDSSPRPTSPAGSFRTFFGGKQGHSFRLIGLSLLMAAIFIADLSIQAGVAIGVLYAVPVLLTIWSPHPRAPLRAGAACSALAMTGVLLSPDFDLWSSGATLNSQVVSNRGLSLIVIWAIAILGFHYRRGIEAELYLASIIENTHDAIIGKTLEGKVTSWNRGAEHMFGYTAEESIGQMITFIIPPERIHEEEMILTKLQRKEQVFHFETVRRCKDGRYIDVSLTISPIVNRWGHLIGVSKIVRDISEHKRMERLLSIQNQALKRHAASLKQSNEDLEQFAHIASHDLQEPLRTIHGFTQLLTERFQDRLDDEAQEFMGFITDGAARMQGLIADLLRYAKIKSQDLETVPVETESVLQDVLDQLHRAIQETKTSITHDPLPMISTNRTNFHHLLQNLLSNAMKFHGPEPPHIHISARKRLNEWHFSVRDNGIGIEPEYFERIFLPFKRLHSQERYQGTGIGLAICKKIVERQGGRIWVESRSGKGTTFTFTIPILQQPVEEPS